MFKNRVVVCLCSSREEFLLCCVHVSLDKRLTAFEFIVPSKTKPWLLNTVQFVFMSYASYLTSHRVLLPMFILQYNFPLVSFL